jgi:eukaryotic-like serine/threonine-protein kinase
MVETNCPERQALLDFAAGRGDESQRRAIGSHLDACPVCRRLVTQAEITCSDFTANAFELDDRPAVAGSHLGGLSDSITIAQRPPDLRPLPEEVGSRFDFQILEAACQSAGLGRLGKYEVLEVLGFGGMGVVFRAYDEQLGRAVAIKVMSRDLANSPTARRRFNREARASAAINHPNVVIIHAVEEHRGTPFLVMELIQGESLRDRLQHGPRLGIVDVLRISAEMATGLAAAHAQGVIHRDIKPGNIMLENTLQRVKITDFGLARVAVDNVDLTSDAIGVGTPAYMAPEQVKGENIDARTDLFALGCVMYAMLRGHSPFHGRTALEVARNVANEDPCPPTADPNIPRFLSDTIDCLLQKEPSKRFQSAAEVAGHLQGYLAVVNQTPTDRLSEVLRIQPSPRAGRQQRSTAMLAGVLACVLLIIAGPIAWRFGLLGRSARDRPEVTGHESTSTLGPTGTKNSTTPEAAEAVLPTRTVSVAGSGGGDYTTLNAALAEVGPGSTIRILDSGEYRESLSINDPRKWHDITIEGIAAAPPVIVNSDKPGDVVTIRDTPGVVLRGFEIRQAIERQFAVRIAGAAAGVTLERMRVRGDSPKYALIYIQGASGESDRPIVIRDSRLDSGYMGIVAQAEGSTSPVRHLRVAGNRFSGRTRHMQVNTAAQDIQIIGNIFDDGVGLELALPEVGDARDLVVANNTFFRNRRWLDLKHSSPKLPGVVIANNLILQTAEDAIVSDAAAGHTLAKFAENWSWRGNHWEIDSSTVDPQLRGFAEIHDRIPMASRDPQHPQFLRLATSLAPAPPELGLLPYVGALAP